MFVQHTWRIHFYLDFIKNRKIRGVVTPLGTAIKIALWTSSPQPKEVSSLYTFLISQVILQILHYQNYRYMKVQPHNPFILNRLLLYQFLLLLLT